MPPHRKKPFSAKQKKKQLQNKRKKNLNQDGDEKPNEIKLSQSASECSSDEDKDKDDTTAAKPSAAPQTKRYDSSRYKLQFLRESPEEIERRKQIARSHLPVLDERELELDLNDVYQPGSVLDMPKRPPWNYQLSKHTLQTREEQYFKHYLENLLEKFGSDDLSYVELNLETWRQLWRVLEMSDIVLLITDIRHPALHFAPTLYDYVTKEMKKQIILVLNKIDLAPPSVVAAWRRYFQDQFPGLHIICFTSCPAETSVSDETMYKRKRKATYVPFGPNQLWRACEDIVQGKVELGSWKKKIQEDAVSSDSDQQVAGEVRVEESDGGYTEHVQYKDGVLTIGCCGYPNVGKSTVINSLVGKKVVSVSRTPGHTKHFQTIFLTPTVKLCDSPGLVFPSLVCKPMQILAGMYPIAQVSEPYTTVGYLAQRIPVPRLLNIKHPEEQKNQTEPSSHQWTAYDICDGWAEKRGYLTARAARNDTYRAANSILRLALEGRLRLCMRPPGYTDQRAFWKNHVDTQEIALNQKLSISPSQRAADDLLSSDSSHDAEEEEDKDEKDEDAESGKLAVALSNPFALLDDED